MYVWLLFYGAAVSITCLILGLNSTLIRGIDALRDESERIADKDFMISAIEKEVLGQAEEWE